MKIAVVTVYDSIVNYGSYLQAFALNRVLEELGHEVYFVRRMPDEKILKRFDALCTEQNRVPRDKIFRTLRQWRRNRRIRLEKEANRYRYELFREDWKALRFIEREELKQNGIELLVCGSDEIWNLHNRDVDFDFYSCFWQRNIQKLAYAVSCGDTSPDELLRTETNRDAIADFDRILPRDDRTQELVNAVYGIGEPLVCDPTILFGYQNYALSDRGKEYGRYLLVYSYRFTKTEKSYILRYAKERKLKIVSPCIRTDFADENVFVSSMEFPSLIANADCVFTSTFHGTIFSLMFAKRFCCLPKLPKVMGLLGQCGALEYVWKDGGTYQCFRELLDRKAEHGKIHRRMDEMRCFSLRILADSIERIQSGTDPSSAE